MNTRQQKFCKAYAATGNATRAAGEAGYSQRTAYSQGQRLLRNVEVKNRIAELSAELSAARIADAQEIRERLTSVLRDDEARTGDRLRAADQLLRAGGQYLPKPTRVVPTSRDDGGEIVPDMDADSRDACIVLPWNGTTQINALLSEDGEIVPLLPTGDDVIVVLDQQQQRALQALHEVKEEP